MHFNSVVNYFLFFFSLSHCDLNSDFVIVWNVPIHKCTQLDVFMDLWKYDIVYNENGSFVGENVTIFYNFGTFPHFSESGVAVNGGIPQLGQVRDHTAQVAQDIRKVIPNPGFQGFAVIDWEEWRPSWYTNWGVFNVYREESRKLIRSEEPGLSYGDVEEKAKREFETSARFYMQSAIMISRFLRPSGLWGYYGFPDCYNYEPYQKYCSDKVRETNDELFWLFDASSALFPSIYIGQDGNGVEETSVFVFGKLYEAMRVSNSLPIYPYSSVHYRSSEDFMSAEDLLITVGQAAALGLPGVVFWGAYDTFNSEKKCLVFRDYVHSVLGPTVNRIRTVLKDSAYLLEFPDDLDEDLWAERIFEFYQFNTTTD